MPKLSPKGALMPPSPIRKLVPYAEEAKRRGVKVYHLNIGQPDIPSPAVALAAIHNMDASVIEYTHSAGIESYRCALAEFYTDRGINISANELLVTTGGSEAITFSMMATCDTGDEIIVPEPYYANCNGFAMEAGVTIVPIISRIENDFALPPISDFEKLITPRTKAIMICNPNNPTGYLYSREELEQLRDLVLKHDLYLIADEVYSDFCYDGNQHYSVMKLEGIDNNTIMIDSVSKRYSMCGVRIGVLASRNKEIIGAGLRMGQARLCPPYLGQVAGEAAIQTPKSYFTEVYNEYIARRNFIVEALNKIEGVRCPMPRGAFYTVVELPVDDADKFAQWLLEEFELEGQTVMVAPASGFYADPVSGQRQVRVAYVLKIEDLRAAVKCLEAGLKAYNKR